MEDDKPTYEQVEKELNDYKELLWQLSDEYKLNVTNAEKQVQIEQERYQQLERSLLSNTNTPEFLSLLGLPACLLDNDGKILKYNNKFKFLVELIGFEFEEIGNFSSLFEKNLEADLNEKFNNYLKGDEGILQFLFSTENPYRGTINLVVRIYRQENDNQYLALFVELNSNEIRSLHSAIKANILEEKEPEKKQAVEVFPDDFLSIKTEIAIFAEKFELLEEILKSPEFVHEKNEISSNMVQSIKRLFNIDQLRNKIVEKLQISLKTFLFQINQKYPELTNNEEKHCMLIKAGLTYKEIAAIMGVSINGVKIARNRLRKKFDLENETKTSDFIDSIFL
jgi:DNA-binding CsgD family transcriptional regulator